MCAVTNGVLFVCWYRAVMQVHVRTRPCYGREDVSCNCAVAVREGNHVLGVYACGPDNSAVAIRYLEDPLVPGAGIQISPSGRHYTVNEAHRCALESVKDFSAFAANYLFTFDVQNANNKCVLSTGLSQNCISYRIVR